MYVPESLVLMELVLLIYSIARYLAKSVVKTWAMLYVAAMLMKSVQNCSNTTIYVHNVINVFALHKKPYKLCQL